MAICRFFLQGNCKFGDSCRNEHPSRNQPAASRNPFAPLQGTSSSSTNRETRTQPYGITASNVKIDLLNERPQWILSSYAPGRDAPIQLFGGLPREQSFEEMRWRHYQLASQGRQQEALQEAQSLFSNAEEQMRTALQDIDGAIRYVLDGENQHPNRVDICKSKGNGLTEGQNAAGGTQAGTFSQLSNAPMLNQGSAPFSSTSSMGSMNRSTFGQPSFAQPSVVNQTGSSFGQPSFPMSKQAPSSAFGQPSTLGGGSQAFQGSANPFQKASNINASTAFTSQSSSSQPNPFARSTAAESVPAANSVASTNPFLRNETPDLHSEGPSFNSSQTSNTFDMQGAGSQNQASAGFIPATSTVQIQKDSQGNLRSWNGKSVTYREGKPFYRNNSGHLCRVWFPDGPPAVASLESLPQEKYDEGIKEAYAFLRAKGIFKDGLVPEIAPKKEWCNWSI